MDAMPIYEFECEQCGNRFEELMDAGEREAVRKERITDARKARKS